LDRRTLDSISVLGVSLDDGLEGLETSVEELTFEKKFIWICPNNAVPGAPEPKLIKGCRNTNR
jgi:hypothetical protein